MCYIIFINVQNNKKHIYLINITFVLITSNQTHEQLYI